MRSQGTSAGIVGCCGRRAVRLFSHYGTYSCRPSRHQRWL